MTISPPESGEKDKKILESPVKADPRPIDFAKLDKPGFWSSKLSKGPKTTTWIWNLHADAHDFDIHTGDAEEATSCLLYTSPSPRDRQKSRMPSSA